MSKIEIIANAIAEMRIKLNENNSPIKELKVSCNLFDELIIERHKSPFKNDDGNHVSNFRPSDAFNLTIQGVVITPDAR
jgi:hypothetical protein